MSGEIRVGTENQSQGIEHFSEGFDEMYILLSATTEKFDIEGFLKQLSPDAKREEVYVAVAPRNPQSGEYHINARWYVEKDEINFRIEYRKGPKEHESDEREPYAEQFMEWIGRYSKYESIAAHIHAHFEYPLGKRDSKFPLPLKTTLPADAEIDGISVRLPPKPHGVARVRLSQGKKLWYVEVIADRRVTFKKFSPYEEVQVFTSVIDTLLEERTE